MIWKTFKRSCNRSCPWVVLAEAYIMWTQNSDSCHIYLRTTVAITRLVRSEALFLPDLPPSKATSSMLTFHSPQIPSEHTHSSFSLLLWPILLLTIIAILLPAASSSLSPSVNPPLYLLIFFLILLSSNHKLSQSWSNFQNLSLSSSFAIHFSWENLYNLVGTPTSHGQWANKPDSGFL